MYFSLFVYITLICTASSSKLHCRTHRVESSSRYTYTQTADDTTGGTKSHFRNVNRILLSEYRCFLFGTHRPTHTIKRNWATATIQIARAQIICLMLLFLLLFRNVNISNDKDAILLHGAYERAIPRGKSHQSN